LVHAVGGLNLSFQLSENKDGQTDNESVKTTRPGRLSMAGFQVTTHGRFSGDHRGDELMVRKIGSSALALLLSSSFGNLDLSLAAC
jgi:hypothetical protein